jgi:alpha-L-arabinofuranosidase
MNSRILLTTLTASCAFLLTLSAKEPASKSPAAKSPPPGVARIDIDASAAGTPVSPTLYGVFFEEINRAGDGGLYAEMIQNRSFEDADVPVAWSLVKGTGAEGSMALDKTRPLNANNPTALRLDIVSADEGKRVGIANDGFKGAPQRPEGKTGEWLPKFEKAAKESTAGIYARKGKECRFSLYARAGAGFAGPLTVTLEKQDGTVLARADIAGIGEDWKKFDCSLVPDATETNARLVVSATKSGTVWLDMVSLFPRDTFKNRPNGLRADLAQMVADMHPKFVRFPGGCFVEGNRLVNASRWKDTIGDVAERKGNWNLWGYVSTNGLGYFEYLQFCEDIGAEPLFVINCGMSHEEQGKSNHKQAVPVQPEFVQDALDAIEYANGPADSQWGSLRAKAGHPAPFNLKMMEVGNENGGPVYHEHFAAIYDAIKAKYPDFKLVACDWQGTPKNRTLDIVDQHEYNRPAWFKNNATRFDSYDRNGPKVYFGEYAVTKECGQGNLQAAVGEAAFMTGLERNGDVVVMASYAPLFVSPSWRTWNPNAIIFDSSRCFGTPSYHVQAMFAANRADRVLPLKVEAGPAPLVAPGGGITLGTWRTQAEFKDVKVTAADGTVLFKSDFSKSSAGWKLVRGNWEVVDGALRQKADVPDTCAMVGDNNWKNYTLELKARKTGGTEGFFIGFQALAHDDRSVWNIGGWGNREHGLENFDGAQANQHVPGSIETGRWYDVRIEVKGSAVRCYLDGKLIHDATRAPSHSLFAIAGRKGDHEIVLKVVNADGRPQKASIHLNGVKKIAPSAAALVLSSAGPRDENSFEEPAKIAPKQQSIRVARPVFERVFPANSVSILRLNTP